MAKPLVGIQSTNEHTVAQDTNNSINLNRLIVVCSPSRWEDYRTNQVPSLVQVLRIWAARRPTLRVERTLSCHLGASKEVAQSPTWTKSLLSSRLKLLKTIFCQCLRVTGRNSWNQNTTRWRAWLQASLSSQAKERTHNQFTESWNYPKSCIASWIS